VNTCYIGVGDDNGRICIWEYNKDKREGKLDRILKDDSEMIDGITAIVDLNSGGCLVAGDRSG
jgi:hypothetical protein